MKNEPRSPLAALERVTGFHQYVLEPAAHLCYVSRNLCEMLGAAEGELLSETEDCYALFLHPDDRGAYVEFLRALTRKEQTAAISYRLMTRDGRTVFVSDTMTSYRMDGRMMVDCVLSDITELKNENQNLRFLNDTIPCGFVKYTCEKTPKVTYLNQQMKRILHFPEETGDSQPESCLQNIYTMMPAEEQERFARYLERVLEQKAPLAGDMTLLRRDGVKVHVFGWVTVCVNGQGEMEFQSAVMDITRQHQEREQQETSRYLKALAEVYDKIFAYNMGDHTVTCLYGKHSPSFQWLENVPMQMEAATESWITGTAAAEDRQRLREFFQNYFTRSVPEGRPPQIVYRALSSSGCYKTYTGMFLKRNDTVSLFCCRCCQNELEAEALRRENDSLKTMQALTMRFTDGAVTFEIEDDRVTPLFTSENICGFFGYTREEWAELPRIKPTIRELTTRSGIPYGDIKKLFSDGEAEFSYLDIAQNTFRRIRAICSQKYSGHGRCYVMLYNMDTKESENREAKVYIRTFGYFDVFVDGQPIAFRNEKSKELFALLADRRGGFVSSEEVIGFLWESESANSLTMARYRKVALRLKNILEEYGVADIVESVNGKRRLITERVKCDLYDYLSGKAEYAQLFKGSYLTNYSWGETTLAELTGDFLYPQEE